MTRSFGLISLLLASSACGTPAATTPSNQQAASSSAPTTTAPPSTPPSAAASAAPSEPPAGSVPPQPMNQTDAFYILSISNSAVKALDAKVCANVAECKAAVMGGDVSSISRRFHEENWVVVAVPAGIDTPQVTTDGTTATATAQKACPSAANATGGRTIIFRVAKTVTKARATLDPSSKSCP